MAKFTYTPAVYEILLTHEDARGLAALTNVDPAAMLRAMRAKMGNTIVDPTCYVGLIQFFEACRNSEDLNKLRHHGVMSPPTQAQDRLINL